mgnify:FL=1|jgi:hypothetical protein
MTTNLPQLPNNNQNQEEYFGNFYNTQSPVSADQYDAVYTFFLSRSNNNKEAAKSLTTSLLQVTYQNGIDPMVVLGDFKKYNQNESFKTALIGLFNSTRRNTSKIGFSAKTVPSQNVMRNIRS